MDRLLELPSTQAAASQRQVVFVTGEAGIGKTALCEAFLRVAPRGTRCGRPGRSACAPAGRPSRTIRCSICSRGWRDPPTTTPSLPSSRDMRQAGCRICPRSRRSAAGAFAAGTHVATAARMLREVVTALEALAEDTHARPVDRGSPMGGPSDDGCPDKSRAAPRSGEDYASGDRPTD